MYAPDVNMNLFVWRSKIVEIPERYMPIWTNTFKADVSFANTYLGLGPCVPTIVQCCVKVAWHVAVF